MALDRLAFDLGRLTWGLESIIFNHGCVDPFTLGRVCLVLCLGAPSFGPGPLQFCTRTAPLWTRTALFWARTALLVGLGQLTLGQGCLTLGSC